MNGRAVQFFVSLINHKQSHRKWTRATNFAGHVGRHMSHKLKLWFMQKYPNVGHYKTFFQRNERYFTIDHMTGEIKIASHKSAYVRASYLTSLMANAFQRHTTLQQFCNYLYEFECFHKAFRLLKQHFETKQTNSLSIEILDRQLSDLDNSLVVAVIRKLSPTNVKYLCKHFPTVFTHYRQQSSIGFTQSITDNLINASKDIDQTIDEWLKHLIIKYLLRFGERDVLQLKAVLAKRHAYLIDCLFDGEDYTIFDFITSYADTFFFRSDGDSRLIGVKSFYNDNGFENIDNKGVNALNFSCNSRQLEQNIDCNETNSDGLSEHCVCFQSHWRSNECKHSSEFVEFARIHSICLLTTFMLDIKAEHISTQ